METKFRGFNKKWHYGDHVRQARALINGNPAFNLYECEIADYIIYSENGVLQIIEVEPESISQYANIKDRNIKEIYGGDVFHVGDKNILYVVEWIDSGFRGRQIGNKSFIGLSWYQKYIELIGNIFENPELGGK